MLRIAKLFFLLPGRLLAKIFFLPGNFTANLVGAVKDDDRTMIRTFADMLFWDLVVVILALVIYV